ncbi:MAG: hypothetical protein CW341_06125 [Bacteroidetes bacterium]|nr:hypothetical protein [Bacteroidota bacterium]
MSRKEKLPLHKSYSGTEYVFKPNTAIFTIILMCFFVAVSIYFAIKGNWIVLGICVVANLIILPGEIRSLKEKIIVCDNCIILQNVSYVKNGKTEKIDWVEIKWCDVKSVKFDTGLQSSFMRIAIKNQNENVYIKSLENYPGERKMKPIIHQYWSNNKS